MATVNDTIKNVIISLKDRLVHCQQMAEMYLKDWKKYEAEVLGLKEAISELENNFKLGGSKHGETTK